MVKGYNLIPATTIQIARRIKENFIKNETPLVIIYCYLLYFH